MSAVVSKYIGETEKNLARVFDDSASQDVVLFFDEADALFGRRSDVKESHDRYANVAVAHFLERLEASPGFVLLSVTDIEVSRSLANRLRRRRCVIVR